MLEKKHTFYTFLYSVSSEVLYCYRWKYVTYACSNFTVFFFCCLWSD